MRKRNWLINIERITQFNFLGLILSSNLKWQCHMDCVARKISRSIGVINTLKNYFPQIIKKNPQIILITIYNSLIFCSSKLLFCCLGFEYTLSRFTTEKKFYVLWLLVDLGAHTEPLFKNLNMLKNLPDLYIVKISKLCFNVFNNNLPDQFNSLLLRLTDNTHYPFRNKTYKLPLVEHEFAKLSTGYNIVRIINNTPNAIADNIFTHFIWLYYIWKDANSYNLDCPILDCFICSNNQV